MMKKEYGIIIILALALIGVLTFIIYPKPCGAGCLLDKQIRIENQIKIKQAELKKVVSEKNASYVNGINEGISGFQMAGQPLGYIPLEKDMV